MLNFEYLLPTKIYFGRDTHLQVGQILREFGATKVLLHYGGGSIKRSGLYDSVVKALNDAGLPFVELGGVKPNPRLSLVCEGIELGRREGVDFILAVGGGSTIDSSKGIGVGLANPECDVWDFYLGKKPTKSVPVGCILTLAAAGSETSHGSVVTNEETLLKRSTSGEVVRPRFAIMNPELTYTLPAYQTACGIVDILGHIIERYFTTTPDVMLTDEMSEAAMRTVIACAPVLMKDPCNYEARASVMWAGSMAHSNFLGVDKKQDWACHRLEHELSAHYDIAHGAGLAMLYPAWMEYVYTSDIPRFTRFFNRVWGVPVDFFDPSRTILAGIAKMRALYSSMGMPMSMHEAGITDPDIALMTRKTQRTSGDCIGCIRLLDDADIAAIFESVR